MTSEVLKGKTALITGASSGLGAEFARQLALLGCHLVLVARRAEPMENLKRELEAAHGIGVQVLPTDLAVPDAPVALHARLVQAGIAVDVLVNNAGFGLHGEHLGIPWEREHEMLMLDVVALMQLTKLFAVDMRRRRFGYILQVSSVAAYQPSPTYAAYAGAKGLVLLFGEAFNFELRGSGVSCTVLSPGITATEFLKVAGQKASLYQRLFMMRAPDVVRTGLKAMLQRRPSVIAGWLNAVVAWSTRLVPRTWTARIAYWFMTFP